jgi:hypothetical protein
MEKVPRPSAVRYCQFLIGHALIEDYLKEFKEEVMMVDK